MAKNKADGKSGLWNKAIAKLKWFIPECRRIMRDIRKPNKEEFVTIVKVSALGLTVIGVLGFLLTLLQQLVVYGG